MRCLHRHIFSFEPVYRAPSTSAGVGVRRLTISQQDRPWALLHWSGAQSLCTLSVQSQKAEQLLHQRDSSGETWLYFILAHRSPMWDSIASFLIF